MHILYSRNALKVLYKCIYYILEMLSKFVKGIAQSSQGFTTGPIPHVIKKLSAFLTARIDLKPMKFLSLFKEFFLQAKDSNSQVLFVGGAQGTGFRFDIVTSQCSACSSSLVNVIVPYI